MISDGDVEIVDMMKRIVDCHDEVLIFTKKRNWLTEQDARQYLERELVKAR